MFLSLYLNLSFHFFICTFFNLKRCRCVEYNTQALIQDHATPHPPNIHIHMRWILHPVSDPHRPKYAYAINMAHRLWSKTTPSQIYAYALNITPRNRPSPPPDMHMRLIYITQAPNCASPSPGTSATIFRRIYMYFLNLYLSYRRQSPPPPLKKRTIHSFIRHFKSGWRQTVLVFLTSSSCFLSHWQDLYNTISCFFSISCLFLLCNNVVNKFKQNNKLFFH